MLQQLNILSHTQAIFRQNKRVNSIPSFEVSSIFTPVKIDDIVPMENPIQYAA